MDNLGKTILRTPGRSDGDGMENRNLTENVQPKSWSQIPTTPSIHCQKKHINFRGKIKTPKFIPFEPYKAAVSPIIPLPSSPDKNSFVVDSQKVNTLASSVIKLYSDIENRDSKCTVEKQICLFDCGKNMQVLEEKICLLEKEKKELASLYQVQTEVNSELKNMLVAAMGEDVQLKVQLQTEDKALLGKQVLHLSDQLDEAAEEAERLTIQANIWESKFKASSLLVKELAQWKASLSKKLNSSIQAIDSLVSEHKVLFEQLSAVHSLLDNISMSLKHTEKSSLCGPFLTANIVQLSNEVKSLSVEIKEQLIKRQLCNQNENETLQYVRQLTRAENMVSQLFGTLEQTGALTNLEHLHGLRDVPLVQIACKGISHLCSKNSSKYCKHCCGEMKNL